MERFKPKGEISVNWHGDGKFEMADWDEKEYPILGLLYTENAAEFFKDAANSVSGINNPLVIPQLIEIVRDIAHGNYGTDIVNSLLKKKRKLVEVLAELDRVLPPLVTPDEMQEQ